MKACIIFLAFALLPIISYSQKRISIHLNVKADTLKVNEYSVKKQPEEGFEVLVLNMPYGSEKIINSQKIEEIATANIVSIDLVYTAYPFDEEIIDELMKRRLLELYLLQPNTFKQSMTKWSFIEQTNCKTAEKAKTMFHGFVIKYMKPKPFKVQDVGAVKTILDKMAKEPKDSTICSVFNRNKDWKKDLIVVDFTGSMSPYFQQLFLWFYLKKFETPVNFVFFNDGDVKPDIEKRVGNTGGIYDFTTNNVDTLIQKGLNTLANGCGGDAPENDVEAILKGIKKYDKAKEVILIADNWADMRDYSLIKNIEKPVRVILCGSLMAINTQYLDLAKATGGSIHTMEEDITELIKMREGDKIQIGNTEFVIKGGKFIKLTKV